MSVEHARTVNHGDTGNTGEERVDLTDYPRAPRVPRGSNPGRRPYVAGIRVLCDRGMALFSGIEPDKKAQGGEPVPADTTRAWRFSGKNLLRFGLTLSRTLPARSRETKAHLRFLTETSIAPSCGSTARTLIGGPAGNWPRKETKIQKWSKSVWKSTMWKSLRSSRSCPATSRSRLLRGVQGIS